MSGEEEGEEAEEGEEEVLPKDPKDPKAHLRRPRGKNVKPDYEYVVGPCGTLAFYSEGRFKDCIVAVCWRHHGCKKQRTVIGLDSIPERGRPAAYLVCWLEDPSASSRDEHHGLTPHPNQEERDAARDRLVQKTDPQLVEILKMERDPRPGPPPEPLEPVVAIFR